MTRILTGLLILAALASGCSRSQSAQRKDQNYQVVEEGQASGVTSTINGPGETPPPMTNTAADTTTNFTLPDNPAPLGTAPSPSNVAGTLPATTPSTVPPPMASGTVPSPVPMTGTVAPPRKHRVQPVPQTPTDTTGTQSGPPATDTTATQPPPPTDTAKTDTAKTDTTKTDTQPPPPADTAKTDTTSTQKPPV